MFKESLWDSNPCHASWIFYFSGKTVNIFNYITSEHKLITGTNHNYLDKYDTRLKNIFSKSCPNQL